MLTGSVIFDSVETDNRLVLFGKDTTILSPVQISMTLFAIFLLVVISCSNLLGRLLMELREGKLNYTLPDDAFDFIAILKQSI
jgi:hypothetical protein